MDKLSKSRISSRKISLVIFIVLMFFLTFILKAPTTQYLNNKIGSIALVSGAAATAATALAAVPDDSTTPLANQIMNFSVVLLLADIVLTIEKLIVSSSVFTLFIIIVVALCFGIFGFALKVPKMRTWMIKILIFAFCFILLIPISVGFSYIIDNSPVFPQYNETADVVAEGNSPSFWEGITGQFTRITDYATDTLSYYMNLIVAMIITSVIFPIIFVWIFLSAMKYVFSLDASSFKIPEWMRILFKK